MFSLFVCILLKGFQCCFLSLDNRTDENHDPEVLLRDDLEAHPNEDPEALPIAVLLAEALPNDDRGAGSKDDRDPEALSKDNLCRAAQSKDDLDPEAWPKDSCDPEAQSKDDLDPEARPKDDRDLEARPKGDTQDRRQDVTAVKREGRQ